MLACGPSSPSTLALKSTESRPLVVSTALTAREFPVVHKLEEHPLLSGRCLLPWYHVDGELTVGGVNSAHCTRDGVYMNFNPFSGLTGKQPVDLHVPQRLGRVPLRQG